MWGYWSLSIRRSWAKLVLPMLAGLILLSLGVVWNRIDDPMLGDGEIARATVINQRQVGTSLEIEYRYETHDGSWLPGRDRLEGGLAETVAKAKVFEVMYNPKKPALHRILAKGDMQTTKFINWGLMAVGGVSILVSLVLGFLMMSDHMKRSSLLQNGRAAKSEVREWKTNGDNSTVGQFTYAYQGPDGRWFEGTSIELPMALLKKFPVGKAIRVAFDPMQPKQSEPDIFGLMGPA